MKDCRDAYDWQWTFLPASCFPACLDVARYASSNLENNTPVEVDKMPKELPARKGKEPWAI